jgi:hypothetical protein
VGASSSSYSSSSSSSFPGNGARKLVGGAMLM